jgi:hypothetical protein
MITIEGIELVPSACKCVCKDNAVYKYGEMHFCIACNVGFTQTQVGGRASVRTYYSTAEFYQLLKEVIEREDKK